MTTNKPEAKRYTPAYSVDSVMRGHLFMEECDRGAWVSMEDHETLQAELADMERDYLTTIEAQDAEHRKQLARLQAECAQLRAAIRRLCNIYVVDDYYMGQLREERLGAAVNRALDAAMEPPK